MRIRSLKPEFWDDEITGTMTAGQALFFAGLWSESDDAGRFEWNPDKLRAHLDPYGAKLWDVAGINEYLSTLLYLGRVVRYEVDGKAYGWIPSFKKHQHPQKPTIKHPPPPALQDQYGTPPVPVQEASSTPPVLVLDGREGRGGDGATGRDGEQHSAGPLRVVRLPPTGGST